jgi:thiamine biosynthesis protein ThiC
MAADEDEPGSEEGAEEIDWGEEIGLDTVIELAKRDDLVEIQWHVMPNIIRVLIADGSIYHFRNENSGIDIIRTLENAGITVGKGGVTVRFSFCN